MTKDEALTLALEALEYASTGNRRPEIIGPAITATKEALAQPDQEPIAWMVYTQDGQSVYVTDNPTGIKEGQRALPLYTTPARREWVGLMVAEMEELTLIAGRMGYTHMLQLAEDKLKGKNT